jgi:hypothetical protein
MFSRIRKRLTLTNIVITLALVFAMSGGAYAAGKYLITSTKQISPKVLKALKGKTGPAGTNGVNAKDGAQGPVGAVGSKGDTGGIGETGPAGPKGATGATGPAGTSGTNGTNGAPGATGPTGPTGQTGYVKTLPSGGTETGQWAIVGTAAKAGEPFGYAFSFPIPLGAKIPEANLEIEGLSPMTECPGGVGKPEANPGHFCIFIKPMTNVNFAGGENVQTGNLEAGETGMVLDYTSVAAGKVEVKGTWAVTEK